MTYDPFEIGENYGEQIQAKLKEVIVNAPPERTALVIRKVLENLVLAEQIARENGLDISDREKRVLLERRYPEIQQEVDRGIGIFIGSVLSAEGG
jgi:hypothetical protein